MSRLRRQMLAEPPICCLAASRAVPNGYGPASIAFVIPGRMMAHDCRPTIWEKFAFREHRISIARGCVHDRRFIQKSRAVMDLADGAKLVGAFRQIRQIERDRIDSLVWVKVFARRVRQHRKKRSRHSCNKFAGHQTKDVDSTCLSQNSLSRFTRPIHPRPGAKSGVSAWGIRMLLLSATFGAEQTSNVQRSSACARDGVSSSQLRTRC
jgi:hypothetical protein